MSIQLGRLAEPAERPARQRHGVPAGPCNWAHRPTSCPSSAVTPTATSRARTVPRS